jgi:hypothetical protein
MINNYTINYLKSYKVRTSSHYKKNIPCIITKNFDLAKKLSKKFITPIIEKNNAYYIYLNQISYTLLNKQNPKK